MATKRNVLVIIADDQGPWALGSESGEIVTPALDGLADRGVRFRNAFCASPVCSPARASILTGLIPSCHGVHDHILEGNYGEGRVGYLEGLETYTDLLSRVGYTCGLSGKWHLGDSPSPQHGFSHWYALATGMDNYHGAKMFRDGRLIRDEGYVTELITQDALSFLSEQVNVGQPWYLSVHYTAPHHPWIGQHPEEFQRLYEDCEFPSVPCEPYHPWGPTSPHPDMERAVREPRASLAGYCASISAMDAGIGRIVEFLAARGVLDSTVVMFMSDNGFCFGHHGIWGKGNGTFPANMYEESVKVPLIIAGPSVDKGRVCEELVSGYDIFPTVLELAGLGKAPDGVRRPGVSLVPLIAGSGKLSREAVVVGAEYGPARMIRTGEWKYVHRYPYGPHELYNLREDPLERFNRVDDAEVREVRRELRSELEGWFKRYVLYERDGARLGVTGEGQRCPVWANGGGEEAFFPPAARTYPRVDLRRYPGDDFPGPAEVRERLEVAP